MTLNFDNFNNVRGFADETCGDGCEEFDRRILRFDDYFGLAPRVLLPLASRLQTK